MSEESDERKHAAPPIPAMGKQAPGVKDARQAPTGATLQTGDTIGGKFVVMRYLGSADGNISYLCADQTKDREVVIKVLEVEGLSAERMERFAQEIRFAAGLNHPNLAGVQGMGKAPDGKPFTVSEFVESTSLARLVAARREEGGKLSMRDVFTVIAHTARALEAAHVAIPHGVVTPYNIQIDKQGVLKLTNLAIGRVAAEALAPRGKGPFRDSIYVAPEAVQSADKISAASDIYSLAMLAVELMSPAGLPADRSQADRAVMQVLSGYPPRLTQLLLGALDSDPAQRPASVAQLRQTFEDAVREMKVPIWAAPGPKELPIAPAVEAPQKAAEPDEFGIGGEDDLFNLSGMDLPPAEEQREEGRYLVQKLGLDYGPYTVEEIIKQLHADEIDEGSQVLDRFTQERVALEDSPEFVDAVRAYLPQREERRRKEAAARAELQRKVKKGGVGLLLFSIFAGLLVLLGMTIFWIMQPDPEALPMDKAFASLDYKLLPPPKEFKEVAINDALMKSLFDPKASEEEIQKRLRSIKKKKRPSNTGRSGTGSPDDENVSEVSMGAPGSEGKNLTDEDVYEVILENWPSLQRCVQKELSSNPGFKGVSVQFFIRPTGTTGGVKLRESQYAGRPMGECLVSRFRSMKFPDHGGFNKGVVFPIAVQ
jgi:eukaryotic-like serine/threonine-protein kinase